jgi:hypothetical protein
MQTMPPPSPGRVIFREGLIFGVLLGIVHSVFYVLNGLLLTQYGLSTLGLLFIVLLWLGVFFWAGARGAKQTGRVGTGSLTGLVTAVFAGIIAFIAMIVYISSNVSFINSYQQALDAYYSQRGTAVTVTPGTIIGVFALCGTVLLLLGIGMGAAMGALGGLLGRSQSKVPPPMYPVYPPYAYGPPPMQPPYPPPSMPPYQNQPPQW